ncbi:peptidase C60 sortase A and B [Candidatus Protofrankia californiensis]|uniref:Peptidase C60 sortase A and B n=1 Tax=Candidatus Protofrankia californiensis TaxID=1839754 RepID=A0A1C3NY40_9ACTN|nr:peptidase C60 sortase A and B [Candidatus Protofrankia californiensis]
MSTRKPGVFRPSRWLVLAGILLIGVSGQKLVSSEYGKLVGVPEVTATTGTGAGSAPSVAAPRDSAATARRQNSQPTFLRIPALGTSAPVGPVGLNADGTLEVPTSWTDVGWYEYGPRPGDVGASVLVGHYDSTTGPAVFYRLEKLKKSDAIEADLTDGTVVRFTVDRIQEVSKDAFPAEEVYGKVDRPELRLITCGGAFDKKTHHYLKNVIVYAHAVADRVTPTPTP